MSTKDPFQELIDELALLRKDLEIFQKTSLSNQDEALVLNKTLIDSGSQMRRIGPDVQKAIENSLSTLASSVQVKVTNAAEVAARNAILKSHDENRAAARSFSQAAGEARSEAWRYFGGFWVWLVSMLATGVALGLLIAYGTETAKTLFSVREMAPYACESQIWGGQLINQDDGSSLCAFWIKLPAHL